MRRSFYILIGSLTLFSSWFVISNMNQHKQKTITQETQIGKEQELFMCLPQSPIVYPHPMNDNIDFVDDFFMGCDTCMGLDEKIEDGEPPILLLNFERSFEIPRYIPANL